VVEIVTAPGFLEDVRRKSANFLAKP